MPFIKFDSRQGTFDHGPRPLQDLGKKTAIKQKGAGDAVLAIATP
ncbi:hypothetical protein ACPOL_3263 [Acidisarcina polymorpha]|uniref:Uncharacterized protein n=1 Tax=Acidisarcina polymorpha TaxID=2211140 RepID=A0A2Z5G1V7_9BACT|nr:hypothetical protein ACPOL_3263 [Acidisarcina polymorpha]